MANTYKFGTMGIEIEFTDIPQNIIMCTHDASTEYILQFDGRSSQRVGGELVSPVLQNYSHMYEWVTKSVRRLLQLGENIYDESGRASIHFHIGYPATNISLLKKTLKWAVKVDPHLMRLGGMGSTPRGYINDFLYYRPIISPPVVQTRNGYGRVFIVDDIMKIKTERGFFTRYGDSYNVSGRYVAQRYVGINFYSIIRKGTIEFRHFNKLLNVPLIGAIAEFLSRSIITIIDSSEAKIDKINSFESALDFSGIDNKKKDLLLVYYYKSKFSMEEYYKVAGKNLLCHLAARGNLPTYYENTRYCPPAIDEDYVDYPFISDTHSGEFNINIVSRR